MLARRCDVFDPPSRIGPTAGRDCSQRRLVDKIRKDLLELAQTKGPARRLAFDGLMLSAHQRITHGAARQLDGQCKTGVPMKDI
jgi:hypothetical protein